MARGDQLRRQWLILDALAGGRQSRRALAETLGVSRKTITRDIAALELFPIQEAQDGIDVYYELLRGVRTPALHLEPDERAALTLAAPSLRRALEGSPYAEAVARALDKLRLIQRDHAWRSRDERPEVFLSHFSKPRVPDHDLLLQAALERQRVRLTYFTPGEGRLSVRTVDPYHLHLGPHGLFLIAWCHTRADFLYFAVGSIRRAQRLAERFTPRPLDVDAFLETVFDGQRRLPILDVHLHVRPPAAAWARERFYHQSQQLTDREDGSVEIRFRSGGEDAIVARILSLGPDCEVLAPPQLRQAVAERAAAIARRYAPPPDAEDTP